LVEKSSVECELPIGKGADQLLGTGVLNPGDMDSAKGHSSDVSCG
jgi:hypothetical protein